MHGGTDWDRLARRCAREARRVLADSADAEDAAQEALLRAWRNRAALRSGAAADAWVSAIARHEALRLAGRRGSRSARESPLAEEPAVAAAAPPDALSVDVRRALKRLSADERKLMLLRYHAELTQPQVASALDLPEGTVKVRLHRARARLRTALSEDA